jgi:hypothetical protein
MAEGDSVPTAAHASITGAISNPSTCAVVIRLAIRVCLLFDLRRQLNHSADRFGTRRQVSLAAAPFVYSPQKGVGDAHLKWAILGTSNWTPARATICGH